MAINVNTVYQTVLLILNKEQRGYMTPLEFNKIGAQSQLEIFETYFDSLNQQLRVPQANTDYADRVVNLDEKISIFKDYGNATSVSSSNVFNLPNQYSGTSSATQQFTANPQSQTFTLSGNALALSNAGAITNVFVNDIELASTAYSISGATLTISSTITLNDIVVINLYPKDFYRLGQVLYQAGALPTEELQRVDRGELYHLLSSNLTKPTTVNPIYIYENNQLTVYPTEITSDLSVSYIRKPIPPIWSFQSGAQYTFQPVSSCNFELHSAEQIELILKILLYAGVVIKNPEIIQVAASQIQQENINQKS
tara:strand:- start:1953 stop:2885 length:933 start_codon:yes stop_codon:yes gene_type:complete